MSEYAERDAIDLEPYYTRHVSAMTAEWLHSKSDIAAELAYRDKRITELEDILFSLGAMEQAPCFCCGYNGPGYYNPKQHACAARHHKLRYGVDPK